MASYILPHIIVMLIPNFTKWAYSADSDHLLPTSYSSEVLFYMKFSFFLLML